MVYAIPTGKQNSFAAQNLPSFGLFVRRQGGVPISLANAFAKPVRPTKDDDDLVGLSVDRLTKHWDAIKKVYGEQGVQATACFHLEQEGRLNGLSGSDKESVEKAINAVMEVEETMSNLTLFSCDSKAPCNRGATAAGSTTATRRWSRPAAA